jgi:NAD-dependent dihydropyrimidine dehydrogenase PreA subunit
MQINIDYTRCTSPLDCAKCAQVCQEAVFVMKPTKIEKFKETMSGDYKLFALYDMMCTGCMECVKVCPVGALEIKSVA